MIAAKKQRPFVALWTIAVAATVAAFVLHLALRGRTVDLGYKLGRARAEQARLREVKRVLSLEAASYQTPQRVEKVARTLLGMMPPSPDRVIAVRAPAPTKDAEDERTATGEESAHVKAVLAAARSDAPDPEDVLPDAGAAAAPKPTSTFKLPYAPPTDQPGGAW